jgi:flagellar hook protein FlgE
MSLYGALFSGVSGLNANSQALGAISDNISNVNTVGYKANDTQFSTLVTEASASSAYSPGGVQAKVRQLVSRTGLLQQTNSSSDLSVDGQGFFVARTNSDKAIGEARFTRAGSFTQDANGYFKNTAGLYLQGWALNADGTYLNDGSIDGLVPVSTSTLTGTAEATANVRIRANLQASQKLNLDLGVYNKTNPALNMAGGQLRPDFVQSIQVFDEQGGSHNVNLGFMRADPTVPGNENSWNVEVYAANPLELDAAQRQVAAGPPTVTAGQLASGKIKFNADGSLNLAGTTLLSGGTPALGLATAVTPTWASGAGSKPIKFDLGSDGNLDGLTQYEARSAVISYDRDGAVFGNVIGVNFSKDGTVTAQFSNGVSKKVYKLPVATFQNPDGLVRQQGNAYTPSDESGSFALNEPGVGGSGRVVSSTLEASTVDLASEFTKLIVTQRAYSASSKIITTANEMLQELMQVIR